MIVGGGYAAYGAGFGAEWATLAHLANHFRHLNEFADNALMRVGSGGRFEGAGLGDAEFVLLPKDSMGERWRPPEDAEEGTRLCPARCSDILVRTAETQ